jgi:hypothetical protein
MRLQTEVDVRNPSSNQPRFVWGKRKIATQCANPQCSKELLYLREGRLALLDMEWHATDQPPPDDGAFAVRSLPSCLFWLCGECAKTYLVKRWTNAGLVVVFRNRGPGIHPDLKPGDQRDGSLTCPDPYPLARLSVRRRSETALLTSHPRSSPAKTTLL